MTNIAPRTPEKIYDALAEQKPPGIRTQKTQPEQIVSAKISRTLPPAKLLALLHAIEKNMTADSRSPVVLFMSPHRGAGADIIAFETAYAGALSGKNVLFIDTNGSGSEIIRQLRFKIPAPLNSPKGKSGSENIAPFINIHGTSLCFATLDEYHERQAFFPDAKAHRVIIDELREIFDLIVVYSESGLSNPLGTIISGLADASIIVAEEGRTRIPLIKDLRRLVDMHGGRVVGTVLNKCRLYIPRFIYGVLFSS